MVLPVMRLETSGKRPWKTVEQRSFPRRHSATALVAGARLLCYWICARPWRRTVRDSKWASHHGHTSRTGGTTMEPGLLWRGNVLKATAVVALAALVLTGCETVQGSPKTAIGGLGGAAAGGGGTAIAASVIGGALVGGLAGNLLDQRDRRLADEAAQRAFETAPSGKAVAWTNPDSGHSGTITPVRTYESNGRYCREFQQTVTIGGRPENSFGTACRQPDGAWQIVS